MKTKNLFTALVCCFLSFNVCFAQAPSIQWEKSLGGTGGEQAYSIQQTSDGGYVVVGKSNSTNGNVTGNHGKYDYWVVKLDTVGSIQWQKSFGGSGDDIARSVQQTEDGGYIIAGETSSSDGDVTGRHGAKYSDYWVIKLNPTGGLQWQKCLGGVMSDVANSIQQIADGGYIVAGYSSSNDGDVTGNHGSVDYWIVKINGGGTILWQKSLGGTSSDLANSIKQTTDGGYIVTGYTLSTNGDVSGRKGGIDDCWIVKLDTIGNIEWQKCLGGTSYDEAYSVQQTTDGGYILAGLSSSNDSDVTGHHGSVSTYDYWVVKLDTVGSIQWQKSLGGTDSDGAEQIQQTADQGYIVIGWSLSTDGDITAHHGFSFDDYWVVKLDVLGNIEWQKSLGGTSTEYGHSIQQTSDNGYILAGFSNSNDGDVTGNHGGDYWIVKLCGSFTSDSVVSNPNNTSVILSVNTFVTVQIDTIANDIITTTDSMFVTNHIDTKTVIKDSTVFVKSQCDSSVVNSTMYSDTTVTSVTVSDTVVIQSSDTVALIITSMRNKDSPTNVEVYPNPFTNEINIDVGDKVTEVSLIDVFGREVKRVMGMGCTVFKADVPSGIYVLKVQTADRFFSKMVVKE